MHFLLILIFGILILIQSSISKLYLLLSAMNSMDYDSIIREKIEKIKHPEAQKLLKQLNEEYQKKTTELKQEHEKMLNETIITTRATAVQDFLAIALTKTPNSIVLNPMKPRSTLFYRLSYIEANCIDYLEYQETLETTKFQPTATTVPFYQTITIRTPKLVSTKFVVYIQRDASPIRLVDQLWGKNTDSSMIFALKSLYDSGLIPPLTPDLKVFIRVCVDDPQNVSNCNLIHHCQGCWTQVHGPETPLIEMSDSNPPQLLDFVSCDHNNVRFTPNYNNLCPCEGKFDESCTFLEVVEDDEDDEDDKDDKDDDTTSSMIYTIASVQQSQAPVAVPQAKQRTVTNPCLFALAHHDGNLKNYEWSDDSIEIKWKLPADADYYDWEY